MKRIHHTLRSCPRLAAALLLSYGAVLTARADYPSTVLSQGPVGYWRLNETVSPQAPPIFANNIGSLGATGNGVYSNAFPGALPGSIAGDPANGAVRLPGAIDGNRVRIPYQPAWNPSGAFSVEFWAKPGQNAAAQCPGASVEFFTDGSNIRNGWLFYQANSAVTTGNGWIFRAYNTSTPSNAVTGAAVNMTISPGSWYHVVGVYDGNTNLTLYVNGTNAGTASMPYGTTFRPNTNTLIPLTFGARADGAAGYFVYNGTIDESAMYPTALTAGQVLAHYQAGTNAAANVYQATVLADSPVGYWRFNEQGMPPAANIGTRGSPVNGSYVYNAVPNQTGPNPSSSPMAFPGLEAGNKAVKFDGVSGSVTIPSLNLNTNTVTITCWLNANGGQLSEAGAVFNQGSSTKAGLQFDVTGGLGLAYNWNGATAGRSWYSGVSVADSQWTFVALIVQPDRATLFVPGQAPSTISTTHGNVAFDGLTFIGAEPGTNSFNGVVDEVAIFGRALAVGEAYSQYAAAVGNLGPTIFTDPATPTNVVYEGDSLGLFVDAGGTPSLGYQWRVDGNPIAGATSSAYAIATLATTNTGTYDVLVTNSFGQVPSQGAYVLVNALTAPQITQGPVGRTLYPGGTISLSAVASGGKLRYQWSKGGTAISGATSSAYTIAKATTNDTASYTVTITNAVSQAVGGPAVINVLSPAAGTYEALVTADGPESWWRLDDPNGSTFLTDSMGRHDGTYINTASGITLGVPGAVSNGLAGTAARFTGTSDVGEVPFTSKLNATYFTLECWAKTTNTAAGMSPVANVGNFGGFGFRTQSGRWYMTEGGGTAFFIYGDGTWVPGVVQPDKWTHLVVTYGTNGLRLYINGQWDGVQGGDFTRNVSGPFRIGTRNGGGAVLPWNGQVDEVAYYPTNLSASQILAHYAGALYGASTKPVFSLQPAGQTVVVSNTVTFSVIAEGSIPIGLQWYKDGSPIAGQTGTTLTLTNAYYTVAGNYVCRATNSAGLTDSATAALSIRPSPTFCNLTNGMVLHLPFDGNYLDSSGRGNNATAKGSPQIVAGKLGSGALYFSTTNALASYNYLTLGTPADLQFGTSTDFSVAYWVKYVAGQTNGDLPFLSSATNSYGNLGITFAPSYNAGGWSYSLNGVAQTYGAASSINNGNWHHVLHSFTRSGNGVTYLDGNQVDSRIITTVGDLNTTAPFNIGQDPTGIYSEDGWATIDDLAVWRVALSAFDAYSMTYVANTYGKSFDTYGPVRIQLKNNGSSLDLIWEAGTLLQADSLAGPWSPVPSAKAPFLRVTPAATSNKFYRVQL